MNLKTVRNLNFILKIGTISVLLFGLIFLIVPFDVSQIDERKEVVISFADNISPTHQIVIDKFNKEYEGKIRVKTIDLPFKKFSTNERKELLTRSLRSKSNKLDLFAIDLIWSTRFARWAEDLTPYFTENELKKIYPEALVSCLIGDELVAIPIYIDIGIMYYRKDMIAKLPNGSDIERRLKESITWSEFLKLSGNFDQKKNPFYIFPADNYEGLVCSFMEFLLSQNPQFFNTDSVNLNSSVVKRSIGYLNDFINKYNISPMEITDYEENTCYSYFIDHEAVFLRGWPSFLKDYKNILRSSKIDSLLGKAALPHLEGRAPSSVFGGWNLMISKYSEHKNEALEFLKYIIKEKTQKLLYEEGAYLPILANLYEDEDYLEKNPALIYDRELLKKGIHRPFLENYTQISDIISYYTNQVLRNNLTIETALENAQKALTSGELIVR